MGIFLPVTKIETKRQVWALLLFLLSGKKTRDKASQVFQITCFVRYQMLPFLEGIFFIFEGAEHHDALEMKSLQNSELIVEFKIGISIGPFANWNLAPPSCMLVRSLKFSSKNNNTFWHPSHPSIQPFPTLPAFLLLLSFLLVSLLESQR